MKAEEYEIIAKWEIDKYYRSQGFTDIILFSFKKEVGYEDDKIIDFLSYPCVFNDEKLRYAGNIYASRKIKLIEDYWEDFREKLGMQYGIPSTINAVPRDEEKRLITSFSIPQAEGQDGESLIYKSRDYIIKFHKEIIHPLLEKQSDIHYLNNVHNESYKTNYNGRWCSKMVIAKLAGNPEYEKIYKHLMFILGGVGEKNQIWEAVLPELYERLKNEKPLKDPYLGSRAHPFNRSI
jgi:hypothetical protein